MKFLEKELDGGRYSEVSRVSLAPAGRPKKRPCQAQILQAGQRRGAQAWRNGRPTDAITRVIRTALNFFRCIGVVSDATGGANLGVMQGRVPPESES